MQNDIPDYRKLMQSAMRDVVTKAFGEIATHYPNSSTNVHVIVKFSTKHKGVIIPTKLASMYHTDMTIVLNNVYFDLTVVEKHFSVLLRFNGVDERLTIPFASIISFTDVKHEFALEFEPDLDQVDSSENHNSASEDEKPVPSYKSEQNIIFVDRFREKDKKDE